MALTGNLTYKGANFPTAYIQIRRIWGGPKEGGWQCLMRVYSSQSVRAANENDFVYEKNMNELAPYVTGQDAFTTCFSHLSAAGGEFAGFASV